MINQETVARLASIINHLQSSDGFSCLVRYFQDKKQEIVEEMLKESGSITQNDLLIANTKLQLYDDLINFDILLKNDLN
jgi:hypothetical protein